MRESFRDLHGHFDDTIGVAWCEAPSYNRVCMSSPKIVHEPRAGTRTTHLGDGLVLISVSENEAALEARLAEALTAAERAVVELAARGLSNSEIARTRGRSARSVANQLATIYRELGISGRRELSAKLRSARGEHG